MNIALIRYDTYRCARANAPAHAPHSYTRLLVHIPLRMRMISQPAAQSVCRECLVDHYQIQLMVSLCFRLRERN